MSTVPGPAYATSRFNWFAEPEIRYGSRVPPDGFSMCSLGPIVYLHLHDARGLALPTTYAAIRVLDDTNDLYLDTTAGGIGGCPYCGNGRATGMVATEDLVNLLEEMGIPTGVDLNKLIEAVWLLEEILDRPTPGHVAKAGPMPRDNDLYDPNLPFVETFESAKHFKLGPEVAAGGLYPWREPIPSPAAQH